MNSISNEIRLRSVQPRVDRSEIKKEKKGTGINKNRDPATAQVSVEMKMKQNVFCGRNKLKSMSRFCEHRAMTVALFSMTIIFCVCYLCVRFHLFGFAFCESNLA